MVGSLLCKHSFSKSADELDIRRSESGTSLSFSAKSSVHSGRKSSNTSLAGENISSPQRTNSTTSSPEEIEDDLLLFETFSFLSNTDSNDPHFFMTTFEDEVYDEEEKETRMENQNLGKASGSSIPLNPATPPRMVLVHPDAAPYAQLCFNQKLGTLTAMLVGRDILDKTETSLKSSTSFRSKASRKKENKALPVVVMEESSQVEVELNASNAILPNMVMSYSSSDDDEDESGWSTGDDNDTFSASSNGETSQDLLFWMSDKEWYAQTGQAKGSSNHWEAEQSLLHPEDPSAATSTTMDFSSDTSNSGTPCGSWCMCIALHKIVSKKPAPPPRSNSNRDHSAEEGRSKSSKYPDFAAKWFRYMTLSD